MATAIPENRAAFSEAEILTATGARKFGSSSHAGCVGVTTDSRGDVAGKLFVALSGERFDGHRYVEDVLARGAYGALVESSDATTGSSPGLRLQVDSTLRALGSLARAHRLRWGKTIVTIGGSAGKTTTRAAVQTMLSALLPGKVHATTGNLNNLVGVPMTLLSIEEGHEVSVVEVGTNMPGEVGQLASLCLANVAVLTCIGLEHSEGLGDLDGIEAEEAELFSHLAPRAAIVGWCDDERVARVMQSQVAGRTLWTYGRKEQATHRIERRVALERERFEVTISRRSCESNPTFTLRTRLLGLPGALASAAAFTVADALGVAEDLSVAAGALDRQVGEAGRLRILQRSDRALVIDDCYNANPVSMRSSIDVAREIAQSESRRLLLVLGDMLELGSMSQREHEALVDALEGTSEVIAVGVEMAHFAAQASRAGYRTTHVPNADAARPAALSMVRPNDVILVKGSRGIHLETIVEMLTAGETRAGGEGSP